MSVGERKIRPLVVAMRRPVLPEIGGITIEQIDAILDRHFTLIEENKNIGRLGQIRFFEYRFPAGNRHKCSRRDRR